MIALQFGKLADHFGDEIGLAQPRGQFGVICEQLHIVVIPAKAGTQSVLLGGATLGPRRRGDDG